MAVPLHSNNSTRPTYHVVQVPRATRLVSALSVHHLTTLLGRASLPRCTERRSPNSPRVAAGIHTPLYLPLELPSTTTYTPGLEETALGNRSQCQGCDVCWLDLERPHLALWQEAARYPTTMSQRVSVCRSCRKGLTQDRVGGVCIHHHPLKGKETL